VPAWSCGCARAGQLPATRATPLAGILLPHDANPRLRLVTYPWHWTKDGEADVGAEVAFKRIGEMAWAVDFRRYGDESDRGSFNPSGLLSVSRIVLEDTVHFFVYHGRDRDAAIEFATNLMGSCDESRQVIHERNLILCEQLHKLILLILLAWVGACRASTNSCGGQHHRGANQSVGKSGDAGAHGRISISSASSAQYLTQPE
jgi:hypothetical protein